MIQKGLPELTELNGHGMTNGKSPSNALPKVLLFIDSVHCGGAQRQICQIAAGLKSIGHDVALGVYYPEYDFFRPFLEKNEIELIEFTKLSTFDLVKAIGNVVKTRKFDWVVSFLNGPNFYALLAKIRFPGLFKLMVGERSANVDGKSDFRENILRNLYRFADSVVCNSQFQANLIRDQYSQVAKRTVAISNCVDPKLYECRKIDWPAENTSWDHDRDWLAVVGQVAVWKNLHGLVDAMILFARKHGLPPRIRWAGRIGEGFENYVTANMAKLRGTNIKNRLELAGNVIDIGKFLSSASGLLHPSLREGYPNAVCESFAVGLPGIISDVSDAKILVGEDRGFLMDPSSPKSICEAMYKFVSLPSAERRRFGENALAFASSQFQIQSIAKQYSELLTKK